MPAIMEKATGKAAKAEGEQGGLFIRLTPTKGEILSMAAEAEKRLPPLQEEVSALQKRLSKAEGKHGAFSDLLEKATKALRSALALGKDGKAEAADLESAREGIELAKHEVEGLQELLVDKNAELSQVQTDLVKRDFFLARVDLYEIYDQYNATASALAEIVKKIFIITGKIDGLSRSCGEDNPDLALRLVRGAFSEIPKILPPYGEYPTSADRLFWHEAWAGDLWK